MWRKFLSVGLVLLLTGAGLEWTAGTAQARPRGGGHFGGGFHGGARLGGYRGGFHVPGYRYGAFRQGAHYDAWAHRYHYPRYYGRYYGTYPYWGYYGAWPGYDYYSYDSSPVYPSDPVGLGDYGADVGGSGNDYGAYGSSAAIPPSPARATGEAEVTVTLPADATLWAQGKKLSGSGSTRVFHSPPLETGHRYAYDFRASWKENGHTITQTRTVPVTPGAHVQVHFPIAGKAHGRAAS
jgi:uncharacterized protein (TIGR03000 family)